MLTKKQISEIKEHLDKAQNPLFLFDNDQDGLCSFLLLRRFIERGKGFPVKTSPLGKDYVRKVTELNSDYVFILDVPNVKKEFFDEIEQLNIPVVWIDHHENDFEKIPDFVNYYNPLTNKKKTNEPVTELCYQITNKKEDLWIAVVGNVSDVFMPNYYSEFEKEYPDLVIESRDLRDIFYKSELGRISKLLGYGLKDKTTNVIQMLKFLMKVKSPYDVLNETNENKQMHKRFNEINSKYEKFLNKAKKNVGDEKFLFFEYGGDTSMSSEIANGLIYYFPDKIVFVFYTNGELINVSGRGKKVRNILNRVLDDFENATGGGHEEAVGARIMKRDLERFKEEVEKSVL